MIRTILAWLRGPLTASTDADWTYEGPELPNLLRPANVIEFTYPCWNEESKRGFRKHYFGRIGTEHAREPRCLNCGAENVYLSKAAAK